MIIVIVMIVEAVMIIMTIVIISELKALRCGLV